MCVLGVTAGVWVLGLLVLLLQMLIFCVRHLDRRRSHGSRSVFLHHVFPRLRLWRKVEDKLIYKVLFDVAYCCVLLLLLLLESLHDVHLLPKQYPICLLLLLKFKRVSPLFQVLPHLPLAIIMHFHAITTRHSSMPPHEPIDILSERIFGIFLVCVVPILVLLFCEIDFCAEVVMFVSSSSLLACVVLVAVFGILHFDDCFHSPLILLDSTHFRTCILQQCVGVRATMAELGGIYSR